MDGKSNLCPAEDSAIRRWIGTFQKAMDSIEAALISAWVNPEEAAAERLQLITPLLDPELDHQQLVELKKEICGREKISYRTISRYLSAYLSEGFTGLKPKVSYHQKESRLPEDFPELLEEAIVLRRNARAEAPMTSSGYWSWKNVWLPES